MDQPVKLIVRVRTIKRYGAYVGRCTFEAVDESGAVVGRGEFDTSVCSSHERALNLGRQEADGLASAFGMNRDVG